MTGKLYGIGAGPGDPELLTLKAIRVIERCDMIAVPDSGSSERLAFAIVEPYLTGKTVIECRFSMSPDEHVRRQQRQVIAKNICEHLAAGKTVGFVTLGDPAIYSTYAYIHELVAAEGFVTEIVPGITSFSAAAAALNQPLCEGRNMLHVIPAACKTPVEILNRLLGTKVIMKSGKNMQSVLQSLNADGAGDCVRVVTRASLDDERVFHCTDAIEQAERIGYFSIVIVREMQEKHA